LRDSWGRSNVPVGEPFDPPWVFGRPEQAGLDALLFSENSMSAARRPSSCFCNHPHGHPCDRPLVLSCKRYRRTAYRGCNPFRSGKEGNQRTTDSYRLSVESVVDVGGSPEALHEKANPRPRSAHHRSVRPSLEPMGEVEGCTPMMNGHGKSDSSKVPAKSPNKKLRTTAINDKPSD
jgi:hypothetical protein